ncbi:hypothetical protein BH20ACT14_BH20ACT14_09010 [soil metagenome]|nr:hypothetical protein [Actinomycetota bacterium]MDQ3425438.1 hypothetical protein [Actinomycetota bacterium]
MIRLRFVSLAALALVLVGVGEAQACVCAKQPLDERLDDADAAVVARLVEVRETLSFPPQRTLAFEVDQRVKGDIEKTFDIKSMAQTDCDLDVEEGVPVGLLLMRGADGEWQGTTCSIVGAGELVAEGGEARGGGIKIVIGLLILALVLSWALRRKARGARPQLPGAPEP